jgi:hypothetical protein
MPNLFIAGCVECWIWRFTLSEFKENKHFARCHKCNKRLPLLHASTKDDDKSGFLFSGNRKVEIVKVSAIPK